MTPTTAAVLAAMVALRPAPDGEEERYHLIADVVSHVAEEDVEAERTNWGADELAAMLVATTFWESKRKRSVHAGASRGDRGRSICLGQIYKTSRRIGRKHKWRTLAGLDAAATRRCIETVADHIEHHAKRCGRSYGCIMASYQGHKSSRNPETRKRLRTFWRTLGLLRNARCRQFSSGPVGGLDILAADKPLRVSVQEQLRRLAVGGNKQQPPTVLWLNHSNPPGLFHAGVGVSGDVYVLHGDSFRSVKPAVIPHAAI